MNGLMEGLGFGEATGGYIAQGGDLGSHVSRYLALNYPYCRGEGLYINHIIIHS